MTDAPVAVVTDHDFADLAIEREVLSGVAEVTALPAGWEGVPETLREADAVLNLRRELPRAAIDELERCRVIARYGIGVDNVDVAAATEAGAFVTNVPEYCVEEVATHATTLLLALSRGVKRYDASVAEGEWDRSVAAPLQRFSSQTVGIVGFGTIGRAVADRVVAHGADVIASDPFLSAEDVDDRPVELVGFDELLRRAECVTIHSPLTEDTRGMFDAEAFAAMRDGAFLVNVARGPIVDGDDLLAALDRGEVAGAGLDVFEREPPGAEHPLRDHERVLTTPHVAWYSEAANADRRRTAAEQVRTALTGGTPSNRVNDPKRE